MSLVKQDLNRYAALWVPKSLNLVHGRTRNTSFLKDISEAQKANLSERSIKKTAENVSGS